jgi:hypothetical protein
MYRNMLCFLAADSSQMLSLQQGVRYYLAWDSINKESEDLGLDLAQVHDAENNLRRSDETVQARINETYCWLIVPDIDKNVDMKTIVWNAERISGAATGIQQESVVKRAAEVMRQKEWLISQWSPLLLQMELDNLLWKESDNIPIKTLWNDLCTYCYLPRLSNKTVLEDAIKNGVKANDYFAYASGFDNGHYIGLKYNTVLSMLEPSGLLVKKAVAEKQLADEAQERTRKEHEVKDQPVNPAQTPGTYPGQTGQESSSNSTWDGKGVAEPKPTPNPPVTNTHFFMSADLDTTRINRDVQKLLDEVINNLTMVEGATVKISLELDAKDPKGFSQDTVRTVSENCRTIGVRDFGFDE